MTEAATVCELHPKQLEYVQADEPNVLFSGGYGSGKTHGLVVRMARLSGLFPHVAHGLLGPTYTALRKDMIGPMRSLLRGWGVRFTENRQDHHLRPEWCTEPDAGIWFAGCDRPDSLKGPNWGSVGINEPGIIDREAYEVAISRARVPLFVCASCGDPVPLLGSALGVTGAKSGEVYDSREPCVSCGAEQVECVPNPVSLAGTPEGFNWLYDEFIDTTSHPDRDWSQYRVITAHSRENPFVAQSSIDRLEDAYDAQLVREKVGGEFVNVRSGAIYYAFSREDHLAELPYDPTAPLLWGLDFNVEPLCSVVCQQLDGDLLVIDEVVSPTGGRTAELVEEFARRYKRHEAGIVVYGDRSGYNKDTRGGNRTDYRILAEEAARQGLRRFEILASRRNPPRLERYAAVNGLLRSGAGRVRLKVDRLGCRTLVRDLEQQPYKPGTLLADDKGGKLGHAADALGYVVVARYQLPKGAGSVQVPYGG